MKLITGILNLIITFKLTNLESSLGLLCDNGDKTSLFVTKEFLHPIKFNAIYINEQLIDAKYNLCYELWSIGVTLYTTVWIGTILRW